MLSKLFTLPARFFDSLLDRVFAVAGALVFAQFPQFLSQYIQRLGGHVNELARIVMKYQAVARNNGKSLDSYIQTFVSSQKEVIAKTGEIMQENIERHQELKKALAELTSAEPFFNFLSYLKNFDYEITRAALRKFSPGIPTTLEGLLYALTGVLLFMIIYFLIKKGLQALGRKLISGKKTAGKEYTTTATEMDDATY